MIQFIASVALQAVSFLIAFAKGGLPEKIGASIVAVVFAASFARWLIGTNYISLDEFGFLIDMFGFSTFFSIALFARRVWPLWASALQLIAVAAHLVHALEIPVDPAAYLLMRYSPSYAVAALLCIVCVINPRRFSAIDRESCWQTWSTSSTQTER
jgi:hypothetical protein